MSPRAGRSRRILFPILVLQTVGRRQGPYPVGIVPGVLGIGVDLGRAGQFESGFFGDRDRIVLPHVPAFGLRVLRLIGPTTMFLDTQDAARLQDLDLSQSTNRQNRRSQPSLWRTGGGSADRAYVLAGFCIWLRSLNHSGLRIVPNLFYYSMFRLNFQVRSWEGNSDIR